MTHHHNHEEATKPAEQSVEEVLAEAQAVAAAGKKERKPKEDASTGASAAPKERKQKEPKAPKLYPQWNEDGTPLLDAEGNHVHGETKMKKPKAPKQPKLDENGNPIERSAPTRLSENLKLRFTELGAGTTFRAGTKRGDNYAAIKEGMTVGEYFEKNGGRGVVATFLLWYIKEGLVETYSEEAPAAE